MLYFPQKFKFPIGTPVAPPSTVDSSMTLFCERMHEGLVTETEQVKDNESGREGE